MNASLSVLLPVYNSQGTLHGSVQRVIEILPDLTHRFEVLIVDDGSTDATCEVAYDLQRAYPQVVVNRNRHAVGWSTAVTKIAAQARGEFLMIHCGGELNPHDVVGLWRLRKGIAEAASLRPSAALGKLWRVDAKSSPMSGAAASSIAEAASTRLGIHARAPGSNLLMIHRQQVSQLKRSLTSLPETPWPPAPRSNAPRSSAPIRRPSFLRRAADFALGE